MMAAFELSIAGQPMRPEEYRRGKALGYPDVQYLRTVPRKKAHIQWR